MLRGASIGITSSFRLNRKSILDKVCKKCNCNSTASLASNNSRYFSTSSNPQHTPSINNTASNEQNRNQTDHVTSTRLKIKQNGTENGSGKTMIDSQRSSKGKEKDETQIIDPFQKLGLNPLLTKQVRSSFPHIQIPTSAQSALIPAILSPNDVLLRAHTGTGKSFALLLSLLAKPRLVFRDSPTPTSTSNSNSSSRKPINGISSILIVPTNELAFQYYQWSKKILPWNLQSSIDSVVQLLIKPDGTLFNLPKGIEKGKKGQREMLMKSLEKLRNLPPHLLIITPGRLKDLLELSSASESYTLDPVSILNLKSLKTLAFDEGDQLLNLPGRFPSKKLTFKNASPFTSNLNHKSPTLSFLNLMMSLRPSFSGGSLLSSAGMEPSNWSRMGDEKRPPEKIRRIQHKGIDKRIEKLNHDNETSDHLLPGGFSIPLERTGDSSSLSISNPLQLVFISATANAVLRHFLGSRTGWLRTGIKELSKDGKKVESGKWIDLTGLSGFERMKGMKENDEKQQMLDERWRENKDEPTSLPRELDHSCLVVDDGLDLSNGKKGVELDGESISGSEKGFKIPLIRNLDFKRLHRLTREEQEFYSKDQDQEETSSSKSRRNFSSSRKEPKEPSERTVQSSSLEEHIIDDSLLNALAFTFASDVVSNGLAVIPPRWSLLTSRQKLEQLGVPVRFIGEQEESKNEEDETKLTLIQSTSARGLDLPNLTHVFILGLDSVGDAVRYTHLAGRVSRIGHHQSITSEAQSESKMNLYSNSLVRPGGKVVTLIKGPSREFLDTEIGNDTLSNIKYYDESSKKRRDLGLELIPIGNDEKKMSLIYRRLRLRPQRFDLSLLKSRDEVEAQRSSEGTLD